MSFYEVRLTKEAVKDLKKLTPRLKKKLREILENHIAIEPCSGKKLVGDLEGYYSVRLTYQDRILYTIDEDQKIIFVHRCRTHYGE